VVVEEVMGDFVVVVVVKLVDLQTAWVVDEDDFEIVIGSEQNCFDC
jgi:hypothetical protein